MTGDPRGDQPDEPTPDPLAIFDNMADWFELLAGMVAAHVARGFTEEQARRLVVHLVTSFTPNAQGKAGQ